MDIAQNSTLGLVLDNRDRRFSPENEDAANPLAGKIQPLRPVRLTSNDGTTTRTHWSGWVESVHPAVNKYGERLVKILCTGVLQFLSSTQTRIELQENQRSDQVIDALIQEVIFPPALSDSWVLGDPDRSTLGRTTKLADLTTCSDFEERVLTVRTAGDNWVRQGGYSDQDKDTFDVYRGIRHITAAERGKFFFDRAGKAVFWNWHHFLDKIAFIRVAPGARREVYVKYKDEKDKRIGGNEVTVEDGKFLQSRCRVEVEAKQCWPKSTVGNSLPLAAPA